MKRIGAFSLAGVVTMVAIAGCIHSPEPSTHGRVAVDKDDGFGSLDVLAVANQAGPELLASEAVTGVDRPLTIAVAPIRNMAKVNFDTSLFLRRLRLELNRQAAGKLHFVAQGKEQMAVRERIWTDGRTDRTQRLLDGVSKEIAALPELREGAVCAMLPGTQVNFVNLNAESYLAALRTKVTEASGRKVRFLLPGMLEGADYYLSGLFVADSDKTEGMINLVDYIRDLEDAEREGKSLLEVRRLTERTETARVTPFSAERKVERGRYIRRTRLAGEAQQSAKLREAPRVAKFLNVILVDAKRKHSIFERQVALESLSDGFGAADYILSAELSDLRKNVAGTRYLLITFQLIEPTTNVIVWETGYETKFIR